MKVIFSVILAIHGLIHLIGFAKAFGYGNITQLTKEITKPIGLLWLATTLLFVIATILFILKKDGWSILAIIAAIISQVLIISVWQDAKFGTIPNLIIVAAALLSLGMTNFENTFDRDVRKNLTRVNRLPTELLTEVELRPLPDPVQRYLRYAGVVNKPKVKNVKIVFEG
jgi:hypothetical protein